MHADYPQIGLRIGSERKNRKGLKVVTEVEHTTVSHFRRVHLGTEGGPGGQNGVLGWWQKWKIQQFHTFEWFIWGPKEVPEGKMVSSGGSRSGKDDNFTLLKGPVGVRRRSWRAKWCSREVPEVENTIVSHFCKVKCGSEGGPGGQNCVLV